MPLYALSNDPCRALQSGPMSSQRPTWQMYSWPRRTQARSKAGKHATLTSSYETRSPIQLYIIASVL